jgi:hypothetical protein
MKATVERATPVEQERKLKEVREVYSTADDKEVTDYLLRNPALPSLLLVAKQYVHTYFEGNASLALQIVHEPELGGWDELFAVISTSLPVDEAMSRLQQLESAWLTSSVDLKSVVNFDLEFV